MVQDDRSYYTFYGINTNDYSFSFGNQSNQHNILVDNYISEDCSTVSEIAWSSTGTIFLYPHHIKKKYLLEGTIEGQLTFANESIGAVSHVSDFRISIIKIHMDTTETILASYSSGTLYGSYANSGKVLNWTAPSTGDYCVLPFWIDCYNAKEINEYERLGIKVEWNVLNTSSTTAKLSVWNDPQTNDLKIEIPLLL